jgi:hypothetical protein
MAIYFKHGSMGRGEKYIILDVIYHRQNPVALESLFVPRPIPLAALSKALICFRSHAGIVGSNPAAGMDACLVCVVCCQVEVFVTG